MATKAFLDTSVLADALLKRNLAQGRAARSAILQYDDVVLCQYAIKEFRSGPFSYFVWLYNKLLQCSSMQQFFEAFARIIRSPARNRSSTSAEALAEVFSTQNLESSFSLDMDSIRADLRLVILRAWRERRKLSTEVVGILPCYEENPDLIQNERGFDLGRLSCKKGIDCAAALHLQLTGDAANLRPVVQTQSEKRENSKRAAALKSAVNGRSINPSECRALGDAVIVSFAPADATILTTNLLDIEPLAAKLGKTATSPNIQPNG
jgi:hypothetical protein